MDPLGKDYLQRDACPLEISVCFGLVVCSMGKRGREMLRLFELKLFESNRKKI
jgi:hypothetical protein